MSDKKLPTRRISAGENLFNEGEAAVEAYLIKSGFVSIWRMENDQRVNLATRGEGEIVGEMALIDDTSRSASVTAESDLEVAVITESELAQLLEQAPSELSAILHQLIEALRSANDMIAMYASRPI